MREKLYMMTELEKKSGLPRRTIHFYSKEGIIPPPFGTGGAAKYGEMHLLRLKLTKILKKSYLKLDGIKEALNAMDNDEMRNMLKMSLQNSYLENISSGKWLRPDNIRSSSVQSKMIKEEQDTQTELFSLREASEAMKTYEPDYADRNYLKMLRRKTNIKSRWERFSIMDGVELEIRSDVDKVKKKLIFQLIEQLQNKLE